METDKNDNKSEDFIDGVVKLHSRLEMVYSEASSIVEELLGRKMPTSGSSSGIVMCLDLKNFETSNSFSGFLMYKNIILRFLPIQIDKAIFFPVRNHKDDCLIGDNPDNEWFYKIPNTRQPLKIKFSKIKGYNSPVFFTSKYMELISECKNLDEVGLPYYSFPDLKELALIDCPRAILSRTYTLVGKQFYAPHTKDSEIDCVLFAQLDNIHDKKAIKVLRWFPVSRCKDETDISGSLLSGGDYFFELGHVSRTENNELHTFMVENNSRILFGKISSTQIKITGGIKTFLKNNLRYPKCLYKVKIT